MPPAAQILHAPCSVVLVVGLPWTLVAFQAVPEPLLVPVYPLKPEPLSAPVLIDMN